MEFFITSSYISGTKEDKGLKRTPICSSWCDRPSPIWERAVRVHRGVTKSPDGRPYHRTQCYHLLCGSSGSYSGYGLVRCLPSAAVLPLTHDVFSLV